MSLKTKYKKQILNKIRERAILKAKNNPKSFKELKVSVAIHKNPYLNIDKLKNYQAIASIIVDGANEDIGRIQKSNEYDRLVGMSKYTEDHSDQHAIYLQIYLKKKEEFLDVIKVLKETVSNKSVNYFYGSSKRRKVRFNQLQDVVKSKKV
ncbi:MAG: hypothetical protein AAFO07_01525 [Bacteroidota bacterium]